MVFGLLSAINKARISRENIVWILQICHCYYPPFLDCARQYAALFKGTPYKVLTVYLTGKPDAEVERFSESDEVIFLGYSAKQVGGLKIAAILAIRRIAQSRAFSYCITHRGKPAYIALLATKLPVLSVQHNYGDFKRIARRLQVHFFKHRLQLIGVSDSLCADIKKYLPNWPSEKLVTVYNHIDLPKVNLEFLTREQARAQLDLPKNAWIIGSVGRLHPDKDHNTLISAFARALSQLPPASVLAIIGGGKLEAELMALSLSLGVGERVLFLGAVNQARKYFKAFDVFALTSKRETFGMVLIEAMAAGVPVISSENGGGAEVVRGAGIVVPKSDVAALAQKLIETSQQNCADIVAAQSSRLNQYFTDDAVRKHFSQQFAIK